MFDILAKKKKKTKSLLNQLLRLSEWAIHLIIAFYQWPVAYCFVTGSLNTL